MQSTLPVSEAERRMLSALTSQPQHIDDIAEQLSASIPEVSGQLMMLELQGMVKNMGSGFYIRT